MRYWWANQNQTYRHEISGGYLWSPKRNANKARNPFYESMREVSPGDIIFSFRDTRIAALGIARSYCYESPKPTEFGTAGSYWEAIGWKIDVSFRELTNRIHPKSHIGELRGLLPQSTRRCAPMAMACRVCTWPKSVGRSPRRCSVSSAAKPTRLRKSRRKWIARSS